VLQFSEIFGIQGSFWDLLAQMRHLQQGQGQERGSQQLKRGALALSKGECGAGFCGGHCVTLLLMGLRVCHC